MTVNEREQLIASSLIVVAATMFLSAEFFHPHYSPNVWIVVGILTGTWGLLLLVRR